MRTAGMTILQLAGKCHLGAKAKDRLGLARGLTDRQPFMQYID